MTMKKSEQIKYAAEQVIGQGNFDILDSIFSVDYIAHAENKEHVGIGFLKRFSKLLHTAIPDIKVLKVEILAEENETVTWQRTLSGTHKKNMMGIPPSNKVVKWNEMVVSRFEENKIAEEWLVSELAGQLMLKLAK